METALVYIMPMPACTNCGRQLRHLYEDHIELTKKLEEELKKTDVPSQEYVGRISNKDITEFVHTYYRWRKANPDKIKFRPLNIIARGLLSLKPLTDDMLPFGMDREPDGQLSLLSEPVCCLRMLMCNPTLSVNNDN